MKELTQPLIKIIKDTLPIEKDAEINFEHCQALISSINDLLQPLHADSTLKEVIRIINWLIICKCVVKKYRIDSLKYSIIHLVLEEIKIESQSFHLIFHNGITSNLPIRDRIKVFKRLNFYYNKANQKEGDL